MIPDEGISGPYYTPLIIAGILYALMVVGAQLVGRRDSKRAEQIEDLSFALVLLAAAYVGVMLLAALFSEADLVFDMLKVVAIVMGFFALLLLFLRVGFEGLIGGVSRLRRRG